MPNIRQMRKREKKVRQWAPESMEQAMAEVRAGRWSARRAAVVFGVPKSSLIDRLSGRVAPGSNIGRSTYLAPADESSLVEYCLYCASHGCPLTKTQVLAKAVAIYNLRHPSEPKTALGQTWWINFQERHHHRLSGIPDTIDSGRRATSREAHLSALTVEHHHPSNSSSTTESTVSPSSCLRGSRPPSSPSQPSRLPGTSIVSASSSAGPLTPTAGHAAPKRRIEHRIGRCGRCKQPDPPQDPEGLVFWVQCDNCHKWFHTTCIDWDQGEEDEDDKDTFWCFWCLDV